LTKVLYVCPYAHYAGHHPHETTVESRELNKAGIETNVLTYCGIINEPKLDGIHYKVSKLEKFDSCRRLPLLRWPLMVIETILTYRYAIKEFKTGKYDFIYLRDGEPFLFLHHLVSLPYKDTSWVISLTGSAIFRPDIKPRGLVKKALYTVYNSALSIVNSSVWKPLYKLNLKRNRVVYVTQNEIVRKGYESYMGGVLKGKVFCTGKGIGEATDRITKEEAREYLGLPKDKFILLSFGAPHPGKNLDTVFKALVTIPSIYLLHGGSFSYSIGENPHDLATKYGILNQVSINNYYITEGEKPYFFRAADAIIMSYTKAFASTASMLWEASKYRVPVIASNAHTLGRDVEVYGLGWAFKAENSENLNSILAQLNSLLKVWGKQIELSCEKFTKDNSYEVWINKTLEVSRSVR